MNEQEKKEIGRPSGYSQELAIEICEWISQGKSLKKYCESHPVTPSMVYRWLLNFEEFREIYTRAREDQADSLADEIIDIADDSENDFIDAGIGEKDDGTPIAKMFNSEHVQRSKLRVEARKWIAAKLKPRKYGDNLGKDDKKPGDSLADELRALADRLPK